MKKYGVKPGFSMKMRVEQAGGVPVVFLVEEVRRVPVPLELFSLPEGYTRVQGPVRLATLTGRGDLAIYSRNRRR